MVTVAVGPTEATIAPENSMGLELESEMVTMTAVAANYVMTAVTMTAVAVQRLSCFILLHMLYEWAAQ